MPRRSLQHGYATSGKWGGSRRAGPAVITHPCKESKDYRRMSATLKWHLTDDEFAGNVDD